jgi:nucleotide-binding universal stress UspA family protein
LTCINATPAARADHGGTHDTEAVMGTYRKILLATDLSEHASKVAAEAVRLARRHQAQLHVVHVQVISADGLGSYTDRAAPGDVHSFGQLVPGAELELNYKDAVLSLLRDRSPAAGILRYAAEQAVDLIVVGTHGRNVVSEMILGSVAQALVRDAPVSVLVVGAHARRAQAAGAGCVLAPVDFSPRCAVTLAQAAREAVQREARLVALHVVDFGRVSQPEALDLGERERRAGAELWTLTRTAGLPTTAQPLVTAGPAAEEILRIAVKLDASLIVLSPSAHGGLERLLLGSVCRPVIRSAPCPVLVHRERDRGAQQAAA